MNNIFDPQFQPHLQEVFNLPINVSEPKLRVKVANCIKHI